MTVSTPANPRAYRHAWALSWPTVLSNLSVPLAGAVDTAVVGHLPDVALIGAVGIGALIFGALYWTFAFLRMATTGFVAQSHGAGRNDETHDASMRAVLLGVLIGLLLILLQRPIAFGFFQFMEGTPEVEQFASAYYYVRIWGAPAALVNFAVLGVLFGLQRMQAALVTQLLLNGTNIVLDVVFVMGFGWGVEGVAAATVISEYLAAALGVLFIRGSLRRLGTHTHWARMLDREAIRSTVLVNFDLMLRTVFAMAVFIHFTAAGASLGNVVLAVNTVLMHFFNFLAYGLDGFANAVEALGGSAYGKRDRLAFRAAVRTCVVLSVIVAGVFSLVYFIGGRLIFDAMTNIAEVRQTGREYLIWMVAMPLIGVWGFLLDGIFVGATRSTEMRNGMALSLAAYLLAVWVCLPAFGNHGLWGAMMVFMVVRALTLGWWYPRITRALDA